MHHHLLLEDRHVDEAAACRALLDTMGADTSAIGGSPTRRRSRWRAASTARFPALNDLSSGNTKCNVDFRRVYATIIDKWLATPGAHVPLLPGAPSRTLGFLT